MNADAHASRDAAPRGEATREALVRAALEVFARDGFDAASTRAIAVAADANQALINYHFGGKQGLYLAVIDHIVESVRDRVGPAAEALAPLLETPRRPASLRERREAWLPPLLEVTDRMLGMMLSPETESWAGLILREQARPTAAFERLYDGFMGRLLEQLTQLVMRLWDSDDATAARLAVIGIYGQVVVWRAGRAAALRHLRWQAPGPREASLAREALRRAITAQLLAGMEQT